MLIEIFEQTQPKYLPVVDYGHWRVAVMNSMEKYLPKNIFRMQKHNETDEVFVLLKGHCTLYVAEGKDSPDELRVYPMEPLKVYNIKKGVWHTHAFAEDTSVLIVENADTTPHNSPVFDLSAQQRRTIEETAGI